MWVGRCCKLQFRGTTKDARRTFEISVRISCRAEFSNFHVRNVHVATMVLMRENNFVRMSFLSARGILILAMVLLPAISYGYPTHDNRLTNEIETQESPFDFGKLGKDDASPLEVNEELLGTGKSRQKRLSDQRRAELETLMALSKMTGKLVAVSRGGRQLDTAKIGRRRRSTFEFNPTGLRKLFRLSASLNHKGNAAYPVIS